MSVTNDKDAAAMSAMQRFGERFCCRSELYALQLFAG
jgi:hypothetical protein